VHLVEDFVPGHINILHSDDLQLRRRPYQAFVIAISPDRPRVTTADLRIVQNHLQVRAPSDHHVVLWPQPGLQARDPARGTSISRVGFIGAPVHLSAVFKDGAFRSQLADLGVDFVIRDRSWVDFRDIDVFLAVRNATAFQLSIKPASKLINAWRAGCPALLGPEPEYRFHRRSELDYIEIRTPGEAIAAIRQLRSNVSLYQQMILNGHQRFEEFVVDTLCRHWEEILAGPAGDAYRHWLRTSTQTRFLRFCLRVIGHKYACYRFRRNCGLP
jgi:hypothetical protein